MAYAELEIGLHRAHADAYQVELRYSTPDSEAEFSPQRGEARIDTQALLGFLEDPQAYGETLAAQVFADADIRSMYLRVKTAVEAGDRFLRVRLLVGPTAPELHTLRWELLRDPESKTPLATSEKVLFSRFMSSQDWRSVRLRRKTALQALIAVSAPGNLSEYRLAEVDRDGEVQRARASLVGIRVDVIGQNEPLTLDRLVAALRGEVDILYLVCHGALPRSHEPQLYLQNDDGNVEVIRGSDLAERLSELPQPPRLVVLASCESAGTGKASASPDGTAFQSSLAPRLAEAGVPAVVAMQGKISMETVEKALPLFFAELLKDGQIDRALAVARGAVRQRRDHWMPALFLRLRGGRIWYEPGFAAGVEDFEKWKSIVHQARRGKAVAILGSGVAESIFGDSRDLARKIALAHGFPLAPHQRDDLPQVSQYLSVSQAPSYAVDAVLQQMRDEILQRQPMLAVELRDAKLPKLLDAFVKRESNGASPHAYQMLAKLPISVYVCATPDKLMLKALEQAGKKPTPLYANWRPSSDSAPVEPPYTGTPTPETPVVYHMLGVYGKNESLVLTEDDYFDYLIATSTYKLIPRVVRSALVSNSLLFLGFQLMDWSFRVLFRLIHGLEGVGKGATMSHVGVQVNPEEHTLADVGRARRYLEKYFDKEANLGVFWGSADDFLRELRVKLDSVAQPAPTPIAEGDDEWL